MGRRERHAPGTYTMLRLGGGEVCALYELDLMRREQGIPPHWLSYVSVEDTEATAARARELGTLVFGETFRPYERAFLCKPQRRPGKPSFAI
jgi:predicted enzyme related to lactoylglutathione lyase